MCFQRRFGSPRCCRQFQDSRDPFFLYFLTIRRIFSSFFSVCARLCLPSSSLRTYTSQTTAGSSQRLSRSTFVRNFSLQNRLYSTASFRLNVVVSPGAASSDDTFVKVSCSTHMVIKVHRTSKGQRRDSSGSEIHYFPDIVFWTMGAYQVELFCHMDLSGV
jgi:hypothetical protein